MTTWDLEEEENRPCQCKCDQEVGEIISLVNYILDAFFPFFFLAFSIAVLLAARLIACIYCTLEYKRDCDDGSLRVKGGYKCICRMLVYVIRSGSWSILVEKIHRVL